MVKRVRECNHRNPDPPTDAPRQGREKHPRRFFRPCRGGFVFRRKVRWFPLAASLHHRLISIVPPGRQTSCATFDHTRTAERRVIASSSDIVCHGLRGRRGGLLPATLRPRARGDRRPARGWHGDAATAHAPDARGAAGLAPGRDGGLSVNVNACVVKMFGYFATGA